MDETKERKKKETIKERKNEENVTYDILLFKYFMHLSMLYKFCFPSIDRLFLW